VQPAQGRRIAAGGKPEGFFANAQNDGQSQERVVVLSDGLWRERFGAAPVIGKTMVLDGASYSIIGVMPRGFAFPEKTAVWIPLALSAEDRQARFFKGTNVLAKLKTGATLASAQAEMKTIAERLAKAYPDADEGLGLKVVGLHEQLTGNVRPALLLLLGAVGLVLLIACANVANLQLARQSRQQREMAIRAALGAGRARLLRQLFTESLLLGLLGAAGGCLIAAWSVEALRAWTPADTPRLAELHADASILWVSLAAALLATLVFGLIPAMRGSKQDLVSSLKDGWAAQGTGGTLFGAWFGTGRGRMHGDGAGRRNLASKPAEFLGGETLRYGTEDRENEQGFFKSNVQTRVAAADASAEFPGGDGSDTGAGAGDQRRAADPKPDAADAAGYGDA
jgi:predicted permease